MYCIVAKGRESHGHSNRYRQVVKVIRQKGAASPLHTDGSLVFARWRQYVPPANACFFGPTRVHNPNGISIGSAVLHNSQQSVVGHARACSFPQKLPLGMGHSGPPSNTWFLTLTHPSPQPKRHLDWFSHFCTAHGKVLCGMPGYVFFPKNCPFAWGNLDSHLRHGSLGQSKSKSQMASRLVQPFFAELTTECLYLTMGRHFSPQNFPFQLGDLVPWVHPSPQPKRHLDRLCRFCRAHYCDRQTDRNGNGWLVD